VINKVDLVKNFPSQLAKPLVEKLNEVLPVPEGLDKWFTPIVVNNDEYKVDCNEGNDGSGALTEDRKAIWEIAKDPAMDTKLKAALEMMKARGAGSWVLLTKERAIELKAALDNTTTEEMVKATTDKTIPVPAGMEALMNKITSYTSAEKKLIAEAKAQKEEKAAKEAYQKAMSEIMADPKGKEAMEKPFPSGSELTKDLDGYNGWSSVSPGYPKFVKINGHTVVLLKTTKGSRLGAFFKYYEKTDKGVVKNIVIDTGRFYIVDDIEAFDSFTYATISGPTSGSMIMNYFRDALQKGTFHDMINIFFKVSVQIN